MGRETPIDIIEEDLELCPQTRLIFESSILYYAKAAVYLLKKKGSKHYSCRFLNKLCMLSGLA
jgi:hypothetical protein